MRMLSYATLAMMWNDGVITCDVSGTSAPPTLTSEQDLGDEQTPRRCTTMGQNVYLMQLSVVPESVR